MLILNNSRLYRKIDPELLKPMRSMSDKNATVILYARENCKCKEKLENMGIHIKYELPIIQGYCLELPYGRLPQLASLKQVEYIAADVTVRTQMNIASQEVGANVVFNSGYKGKGISIAFIDTGIYPHADFIRPQGRIKAFKDFVNDRDVAYDDNGHGSFVAGVAAGSGYQSNGKYKGIAPEADIIMLKALDNEGGGGSSDILAAMQWVLDNYEKYNIRILSLSLGSNSTRSSLDALARGAETLWVKGIVIVAAAGNSGPNSNTITTPGVSGKIITVGAIDDKRTANISDDEIANFSSRGPVGKKIKPDIVAPGVNITSINSDTNYTGINWVRSLSSSYTTMSGTSVATPLVAGAAALLLQKNPEWTPEQIKEAIMNNAIQITKDANVEGKGIINIKMSMQI